MDNEGKQYGDELFIYAMTLEEQMESQDKEEEEVEEK